MTRRFGAFRIVRSQSYDMTRLTWAKSRSYAKPNNPLPLWISVERIGKLLRRDYDFDFKRGGVRMAQELMVDVHGPEISVFVRGTCLKTTYRKGNAPWLVCTELRADDPEAILTRDEFRALAWTAANAKAREMGWIV